ncbi:translation initiation factor eIF-2B subunit gamma-like [Brassica rapa]|uniref:translation initiation factor eIF-2B subunit gamma-like n=1 Tax=Brassica campestris TaxID=3711 RepID=UPI00142D88B7|nr:translation initiation factor eIF-2B subunit gamma-like [Brassica rapa]
MKFSTSASHRIIREVIAMCLHTRHDAAVTAMLCAEPVTGPAESGGAGGKDKTKKPACYDIIGLDSSRQFLLYIATGVEVKRDTRLKKGILCAAGKMEIRSDLMDSHIYAFKRSVLQEVLEQKPTFRCLKQDVLPYLVRTQLRSDVFSDEKAVEENGNGHGKNNMQNNDVVLSQILSNAFLPSFHKVYESGLDIRKTHKCCVYIADESKYCVRLNSIQAFMDVNRDVIGDANHLSGYSFSAHHNIVHPSAELGSKTTVGPHCMLGEGSQVGDKCNVKRSVIGRHCRIGFNVKVVNSVVMDHATIGDGCSIQGSVICSNAQLQERVALRDCQVEAGYVVFAGGEHKGETFARK